MIKKIFSNVKIVILLITLIILISSGLGYLMGQSPNNVRKGLSYGFMGFSILPITICLFGVKELGAIFPGVSQYLDSRKRKSLTKSIDLVVTRVIYLAFLIVLLQVIASFVLLYYSRTYEYVVLGILFGGVISSLIYGLYVIFSIRKFSELIDSILDKNIHKEQHQNYVDSFRNQ